jgi:quercetin dioxygenase-like cupin family protein
MRAHDLGATLDELAELEFRELARFNRGSVGVFWASGGTSPWERHPDDDELLQVLEGEAQIVVLTDEGPVTTLVCAGSVFVVPRGLWHRHRMLGKVKELYVTPGRTEHSTAEDPRDRA